MRSLFRSFSLIPLLLISANFAWAKDADGFYERRKEGFYWYQDDVQDQHDPEYFQEPQPDSFSYPELWRMRPEKFATVLKDRLYLAMQAPTEKNVYSYLEAQDVAKRKSMAFSGVMGLVAQANPKLSHVNESNLTGPGKKAYNQYKEEEIENILDAGAKDFALLVFESQGCRYCEEQRPIIDRFQATYGWTIKFLNIDGFRSLAEKYGIEITPSILMVSNSSNKAIPISSGVISMAELNKRVMRAIRYLSGETKPEQWFNEIGVSDPLKNIDQKGRGDR